MNKAPRVIGIDLLRLVATFQMVQGHAIDAVLAERFRQGALYESWVYVRGFTAPAFLFAAGYAYFLTTLWNIDAYKNNAARKKKRIKRSLLILALGYLMRFPVAVLWDTRASLEYFAIVDILQCIGLSLLLLEGLVWVASRRSQVFFVTGVMFVGCVLGPAVMEAQPWPLPWRFVYNYLSKEGGSIFPFFPYAAYLLAGVMVAALCATANARVRALRHAVVFLLAFGVLFLPGAPAFGGLVFERLLGVLGACVLFELIALGSGGLREPWTRLCAQTLAIYYSHVWFLYGQGFGIQDGLGRTMPPTAAIVFAVFCLILFGVFGYFWPNLRWRLARLTQRTSTTKF